MYSGYIHEDRRAVSPPESLVDEKGRAVFGTFNSEFKRFDLLRIERPMNVPNMFNRFGLTQWQATEVHIRDGFLLAAVCDMGVFSKMLHVFYDKRSQLAYTWDQTMRTCKISRSLLNNEVAEGKSGTCFIRYENALDRDQIRLSGKVVGMSTVSIPSGSPMQDKKVTHKKKLSLEYDLLMKRVSLPSCVSMPFDNGTTDRSKPVSNENTLGNRPVYSQKDLLSVSGRLLLDGESLDILSALESKDLLSTGEHSHPSLSSSTGCRKETVAGEDPANATIPVVSPSNVIDGAVAIVDDHRGYYPRHSHYDWLSSMGYVTTSKGTRVRFGFNLTRNEALYEERYNENILWFDGRSSLLPPVVFKQEGCTKEFSENRTECVWTVEDAHGMVQLRFRLRNVSAMVKHAVAVHIEYFIVFGTLEGYVRDEDGEMYHLDGWTAIGEDKTVRFF